MDKISQIPIRLERKTLNPSWELAAEVGKKMGTSPKRWLRYTTKNSWAVEKALIDFKELYDPAKIKSKIGWFQYLINKHIL